MADAFKSLLGRYAGVRIAVLKITDLIDARPRCMGLDALLYDINIRTKGVPTKWNIPKGGWETYGDVLEMMRDTKTNRSNGRKKISKQSSTISSYAQKIVDLINAHPCYINLDKLLKIDCCTLAFAYKMSALRFTPVTTDH